MPDRNYLAEPFQKFAKPSFRAKRLIGFDTGKSNLKREHEGWLVQTARAIPLDRNFTIYIFGYASKLGFGGQTAQQSDVSNVRLSFDRANKAAMIMEMVNPRVTTRVDPFMAEGNHDYSAAATDDSREWRAVEVHVFLDDAPLHRPDPHRLRIVQAEGATEGGRSLLRADLAQALCRAQWLQET